MVAWCGGMDTFDYIQLFLSYLNIDSTVGHSFIDDTQDEDHGGTTYISGMENDYDIYVVEKYAEDGDSEVVYHQGVAIELPPDEGGQQYTSVLTTLKKIANLLNVDCEFYEEGSYEVTEIITYKNSI